MATDAAETCPARYEGKPCVLTDAEHPWRAPKGEAHATAWEAAFTDDDPVQFRHRWLWSEAWGEYRRPDGAIFSTVELQVPPDASRSVIRETMRRFVAFLNEAESGGTSGSGG